MMATKHHGQKNRAMATLFAIVALDLIGFGMVVPLLPLYAEQFEMDGRQISLLLASYSLMQCLFAPAWGSLSDRIGRRPVLLVSLWGNVIALVIMALAKSFAVILLARLVAGMATANISVASAYVADVTEPSARARGMGIIGAAFGLGFVLGPMFAGELLVYGQGVPIWAAAALSLANVVVASAYLQESLPKAAQMSCDNPWYKARWRVVGQVPALVRLLVLVGVQITGFAMMEMALALFCEHRLKFDGRDTGRLLGLAGIVLVIVQGGLVGRLVKTLGEPRLVSLGLMAMSVGLGLMALVQTTQWGRVVVGLTVLCVGQGVAGPALSAWISRAAPPPQKGAAMGLAQSVSALGRVFGPLMAGALWDAGGPVAPFVAGALLLAAAAAVSLLPTFVAPAIHLAQQNTVRPIVHAA